MLPESSPPSLWVVDPAPLTAPGTQGVISSVEAEDGCGGPGEFDVWVGLAVVVGARLVAVHHRGEALVELTDGTRLDGVNQRD